MLIEAPPYYLIDGVSIMRDHADPLQFYYLPLAPRFPTRTEDGVEVPAFLLLKIRSQSLNGGFAEFDVDLGMAPGEMETVRRELQRLAGLAEPPRLAPVPVVDGSVQLMIFGATDGDTGSAGFVRAIRHAAKPALFGDNRAAFSVELDERGVTVLDQAMAGDLAPIGVVYSLDYLALRPAYHVRLSIDWDRTQDILDETFGHEGQFTDIQIQDVVERLEDERAVTYEVDTTVPEDDDTGGVLDRRNAAAARVRDMIIDAFFESSLDPLRRPPDGWDRAREVIKSFAPQRTSPIGVFTYKKLHYTRIDAKRLDVNFSERTTARRTIYPQGHLDGLFRVFGAGLDRDRLVRKIDADDPWFKRRKVQVVSHADFAHDPVRSITATLTYQGQPRTVRLDAGTPSAVVEWPSVVADGQMIQPVDLTFAVDLEPAEAGERPARLVSEAATQVLGEIQGIEPRDLFSLETIPVLTLPSFPFDRYPRVDVQLRYDDPAHGIRQDDVVHLTAEAPQTEWLRFLVGPPAGPVVARLTYRAADNRDHVTPFAPLGGPQLDVPDPFPRRLKVSIVPVLDFAVVDRAWVDLVYEDPANGIRAEDSIEIVSGQSPRTFVAERADPGAGHTRYRATVLMKDTTLIEGPWSTTVGTRIFVRADVRGHRAVTLRAPADFATQGLKRIHVEARAKDEPAGLSFEDAVDLTAPDATAVFEFDFATADAYELKIRRFFRNGLSSEQDWRRFDQDDVTIPARP
ncbi:hypothetical protein [Microbispora sp. NBRC 16548]|uniref:hypothetical protein n=1 Tax=Microbispora sp. NBRC 16548 TaxID=3030994 RepID=UPI0024A2A8D3|nr:hypothetical protein [Microbispora sp. NBRC 16548]GLX10722.1 hypothetical protein Misp03_76480 [Microbispora sp. NBRC 16548]